MNKDWKGDTQSVMVTLNASSHSKEERAERDFYETPRKAVEALLELETFNPNVWEPAVGEFAISDVLEEAGYTVRKSDIIDRVGTIEEFDFLNATEWDGDLIFNPPYSLGTDFIETALKIVPQGAKIAMFVRIQFLEGVRRRKLFDSQPPKRIWVSSRTLRCAKNGDWVNASGNASSYIWMIWEKGFTGKPELGWFN